MKEIPESEVQAKFFADTGEKRSEVLGKIFADFRPLISKEKWPQEISRKILHIFREVQNKILSQRESGSGGPQLRRLQS